MVPKETWYFNHFEQTFIEGAKLNVGRVSHSVGLIKVRKAVEKIRCDITAANSEYHAYKKALNQFLVCGIDTGHFFHTHCLYSSLDSQKNIRF